VCVALRDSCSSTAGFIISLLKRPVLEAVGMQEEDWNCPLAEWIISYGGKSKPEKFTLIYLIVSDTAV